MGERIIHILPEQVASQIAAGEVVERPASAVKELAENSLDAGARRIEIEIERGGAAGIAVSDDGCGMGREDAILSLRRHATSKIRDAADLSAIRTLGFRGEALAAIASVSRMRLVTRRAADQHGHEIVATGGEIEQTRVSALAPGTRIEARELFFNTPARLKFLRTVATEQAAVAAAIQRLALAHWRVAFSLAADGRSIFDLPRAASALERTRQLFGGHLAERLLAFERRESGMCAWGLAATSQESFASPRMIFTFVNGRAVSDRMIARAVGISYQTLIPRGRHPAAIIFLEIDAGQVDVNVHPMKSEVRFRRAGAVFELVHHALRARLADQTVGARDEGGVSGMEAAEGLVAAVGGAENQIPAPPDRIDAENDLPLRLVAETPAARLEQRPLGLGYARAEAAAFDGLELRARLVAAAAAPMRAHDGAAGPIPRYSALRILGQVFAGYIALEDDEGLLLVDQHAAHERVTFERLRAELRAGGIRTQAMLAPATIELAPGRAAQVLTGLDELRAIGFELEPFGPAALLLKGAPAVFGAEGGATLLRDMIDAIGEGGSRARGEGAFEELLKSLACHGSVRAGRALDRGEMAALLAELDQTEFKSNCPHGRPVHIRFGRGQIERMFRR